MTNLGPKDIERYLSLFIEGQDEAKRTLSNVFYMQWMKKYSKPSHWDCLPSPRVLLIGNSGSGKTALVRKCAEYTGLKMYEMSGLDIAAPGWQGFSMENHLEQFLSECRAEKDEYELIQMKTGVIFIDEIDKICKPAIGSGGSDHNLLIQHALLKHIEGVITHLKNVKVDTSHLLFICAGHFEKILDDRVKESSYMGFTKPSVVKQLSLHDEVIAAGMIPELAGRIPIVCEVKKLSKESIRKVVMEVEESVVEKYLNLFSMFGKDVEISEQEVDEIVDYCYNNKIGMRGLEYIVYKVLEDKIYNQEIKV